MFLEISLLSWSLTCIIIALSVGHHFVRKESFFSEKNIKFVRGIPVLGSLWPSFFGLEHFTASFEKIYTKYPDERIVGFYDLYNSPKYMIRDVELIKQIAIKDFDYFVNHSFYVDDNNDPFFGRSLFVLRDQRWRKMRATLSPAFTGRKMRLMFNLTNEVADAFGKYLKCDLVNGQKDYDMKDVLTRFCNDVIASTAFGLNVNSIKDRKNEFYKVAKSISEFGFVEMLKLFLYSVESLSRRVSVRLIKRYDEKYLKDIILNTMEFREKNHIVRHDMLNILMDLKRGISLADDDDGETNAKTSSEIMEWSDNDLLAQCMLFLLAGFGTVSLTLCFMVHEICVNPDIQERLYHEIQDVKSTLNGQPVTYEALNNMKYIDQVLQETMRRWPQSGFSSRYVNTPYVMHNTEGEEIHLNVGDVLVIPSNAIHADEKYYPNPTKFDPERFSDENKHKIPMGAFLAFGIGPRACIASRFAAMEIKSCVYHMLDHFSFEMCEKTQHPIKLKATSGNIEGEKGFWVRLKSRERIDGNVSKL
ncbi:probable cytochrome P450 9f2 [Bradysia coprophila]|uniref:probable cytochrome P450 9f2 n=1 Tax=Bradysia coprophila TaxID=38358 RepID=UPI00187D9AF7|nr:probable cytochrome P450 9f2 [Bradysia coprophila]